MKKYMAVLLVGIIVGVLFTAVINCGGKGATEIDEEDIVARVNGVILTIEEVEHINEINLQNKLAYYPTKEEIVEDWIYSEVLYQQAEEERIFDDPEISRNIEYMRKGIMIKAFWQKNVYDKYPEATTEDAHAFYEEVKDTDFKVREESYWMRRIAVGSEKDVEKIRAALDDGEAFEELALKKSVFPDKTRGGNMSYMKLTNIPTPVRIPMSEAKIGDVIGPYQTGDYFVLYKLEDKIGPGGYIKTESFNPGYLEDRAKVFKWKTEAGRLGESLIAKATVERNLERLETPATEMLDDKIDDLIKPKAPLKPDTDESENGGTDSSE